MAFALFVYTPQYQAGPEDFVPSLSQLSTKPKPCWVRRLHGEFALVSDAPILEDSGWWVAGDVRIDNRDEIASRLHIDVPAWDLSLLIAAWFTWGKDIGNHLVGDYAAVLAHPARREVFALRDCLGNRPLFYHRCRKLFGVSSSALALADHPAVGRKLNKDALFMWLQNDYDDRVSMFATVKGLQWGECLTFQGQKLDTLRYWYPERIHTQRFADPRDYGLAFIDILERCVADRCRSLAGVVGTTLSGGLDSSSVTAFAARHAEKEGFRLLPFSFRFRELKACDESELSAQAAQFLGLQNNWLDGEPLWLFRDVLMDGVRRDTPFVGFTALDRAMLSGLQAKGGDVLLTGHGGDNVNTGISERDLLCGKGQRGDVSALKALVKDHGFSVRSLFWRLLLTPFLPKNFIERLRPRRYRVPDWVSKKQHEHWCASARLFAEIPRMSRFSDSQAVFELLLFYAAGVRRSIHYYHRLGPEYGVEVRHPYFDRRLFEFMMSVPPDLVRPGPLSKQFCRENMKGLLPEEFLATLSKPLLCAFYHDGVRREYENLKKLMQNSLLADMGLVDSQLLVSHVDTYLAGDPNKVIANFITVVMMENWLYNESAFAPLSQG